MTIRNVPIKPGKSERQSVDWFHTTQVPYTVTIRRLQQDYTQTVTACCDAEARFEARALAKCVMGTLIAITKED